jgi:hypothetical protein
MSVQSEKRMFGVSLTATYTYDTSTYICEPCPIYDVIRTSMPSLASSTELQSYEYVFPTPKTR